MSTIESKKAPSYTVNNNDLIPLVNDAGDTPQSVTPHQLHNAMFDTSTVVLGSKQYPTLDIALNHILNNTPAKTEYAAGVYGGTVSLNQYDDVVTFTGMTATFNQFGQTNLVSFPLWIEFNNDGKLYLMDKLMTSTSLRIMAGYKEASITGATYKFYNLPSWIIKVGAGKFILEGLYNLSDIEACISFVGAGKLVSRIGEETMDAVSKGINPPNFGAFELSNLSVNGATMAVMLNGAAVGVDGNFGRYISMDNIILTKNDVVAGTDVVNLGGALASLNNVEISGKGEIYIIYADKLRANNIHIGSESMGSNGFAFRCHDYQCTKPWSFSNMSSQATSGTGGIWFHKNTVDSTVQKTVVIQGCEVEDKIIVINDSGTIDKFVVYSKHNTLSSFSSDGATVESTNDSKLDGSVLDAPTLLNSGVVN